MEEISGFLPHFYMRIFVRTVYNIPKIRKNRTDKTAKSFVNASALSACRKSGAENSPWADRILSVQNPDLSTISEDPVDKKP